MQYSKKEDLNSKKEEYTKAVNFCNRERKSHNRGIPNTGNIPVERKYISYQREMHNKKIVMPLER